MVRGSHEAVARALGDAHVRFDAYELAPKLKGGHASGARAAEAVEHEVAFAGRELKDPLEQLHGLLGLVHAVGGRHGLAGLDVLRRPVRSRELVHRVEQA